MIFANQAEMDIKKIILPKLATRLNNATQYKLKVLSHDGSLQGLEKTKLNPFIQHSNSSSPINKNNNSANVNLNIDLQ